MYGTAHRIKSRKGLIGINAFLHLHGEDVEGIDWNKFDMSFVSEKVPGQLVSESIEVAPGGNQVLSYLDVACPDDTELDEITRAVGLARAALVTGLRPLERSFGKVVVRFGAVFGLEGAEEIEYAELAAQLGDLLEKRVAPVWAGLTPLRIEVEAGSDSYTFRLAEVSTDPARDVKDVSLPIGVVQINYATYDDFERLHGDLMMHLLPTLTGLSLEELRSEGGVVVVEVGTARVVWEWPRRSH